RPVLDMQSIIECQFVSVNRFHHNPWIILSICGII
ncbi:unnamed protein product, partial [marine sediment metagenome]